MVKQILYLMMVMSLSSVISISVYKDWERYYHPEFNYEARMNYIRYKTEENFAGLQFLLQRSINLEAKLNEMIDNKDKNNSTNNNINNNSDDDTNQT